MFLPILFPFAPLYFCSNCSLQVIIKWRGKPVFIRHRTEGEIEEARDIDWHKLRDPQSDEDRTQKPEWLIMLGGFINTFNTIRLLT